MESGVEIEGQSEAGRIGERSERRLPIFLSDRFNKMQIDSRFAVRMNRKARWRPYWRLGESV
ncbi:hypothetical protein RRSWK_02930 [Rhodopirellula sp. SWK7]|nr:hypothetical protein RRSWK_02930 [Rhodopirellula sp. SWK7]